eukprot:6511988-Alexandrium_andersonii.AAC.1
MGRAGAACDPGRVAGQGPVTVPEDGQDHVEGELQGLQGAFQRAGGLAVLGLWCASQGPQQRGVQSVRDEARGLQAQHRGEGRGQGQAQCGEPQCEAQGHQPAQGAREGDGRARGSEGGVDPHD